MDEEVYFCRKNTNKRKFAGTAKRKGSTLRKSKASDWFQKEGGHHKQNFVMKFVSPKNEWDRKSLQEYSDAVIEDGGIREFNKTDKTMWSRKQVPLNSATYGETSVIYSMNKKKRWLLPKYVENVMREQAKENNDLEPDLTLVHRSIGPHQGKKMHMADVTSICKSRVMKKASTGKKNRVNKENYREVVKKCAKKPYSFTSDLLGMTQGNQDSDVASQPEIMYEFTTSRKLDDYPVHQPMVSQKLMPTVMKLRGAGRQKTRRYLECDHRSIQSDIQAFRDRENFKAIITAKKERALVRKAKSESMIFSMINNDNVQESESDEQITGEGAPVEAVVAWEHLDNDLSIIDVKPVSAKDPKESGNSAPTNCSIDVLISKNSLSKLANASFTSNSKSSPQQTAFDVSQALKKDFGITIPPFFAIVQHLKENNELDVGRVAVDQQTKLMLTSSDEDLQMVSHNYLKQKFSAESNAGFFSVHECSDVINDLLHFMQNTHLRDSQMTDFKSLVAIPKSDLLQPLLAEFGLHHESLNKSDIVNMMDQPLSQSINNAEGDGMMWDDDDFVLIVPPATACDLCSVDFSNSVVDHLALSPCYHRCCISCWVRHIRSALNNSSTGNVACPSEGCTTMFDDITLMALLPENEYWQFKQKRVDAFVAKNKRLAWCPNKLCGKAVKVVNNSTQLQSSVRRANILATMICECGAAWCTACGGEAHWPATCMAYDKFGSQIQKHVEHENSIRDNVKSCPQCKLPITVDTANAAVKCICGHTFCWTCPDECTNDHENVKTFSTAIQLDSSSDFQKAINYRAKISSTFYREILDRRLSFLAKRLCLKPDKEAFALFSKLTDWFTAVEPNGSSQQYENNIRRFTQCAASLKELQHVLQYLHVVMYCKRPYNRKQRTEIKLVMNNLESTANDLEWSLLFKECDRGEVKLLDACEQHVATGKRLLQTIAKIIA